jgi:hypothetical protein
MFDWIGQLKSRNESLFYFSLICFLLAVVFFILTRTSSVEVAGVNAWYKPFKFAISIGLYAATMAWYVYYLPQFNTTLFNWLVIVLLGFEIVYISIQAARGQLSHYNISTTMYSILYNAMAAAATIIALYTAYIAVLFFRHEFTDLPVYYVWSIRAALILFVVFSLEGFVMGSRLSHTIGGADGGAGLPVLNWSTKYGDPRIAHFIGMHALQLLPLISYYLLRNVKATLLLSLLYALLALFTLVQALKGKPFHKF